MVERAQVERYRVASSELSRLVAGELAAFFAALDLSRPERSRDALLEFMPLLVSQYGQVAESLALEWYAEQRAESGAPGNYRPGPAPLAIGPERVELKVRDLAGKLWTPEGAAMLGGLQLAADKYVKQFGRDAIAHNAEREGASWARVPTGKKTCAFCLVLASRDAAYTSERSAGSKKFGDSNRFHGKCDCEIVPIRSADDYPAGYLPDSHYDMYRTAAEDNGPEVQAFLASLNPNDKNKQLKAAVFSMRRNFPDAVNDGVHTH